MLAKRNLGQLSEDKMSVSFEDKVSFLCAPESYRERTQVVSLLQTHHAWLFMTERHVYKMKKPFRQGGLDYSSLESRRWLCTEEYRLNRRLAKNTYLGVVPLKVDDNGRLNFDAEGCIVEWLVKIVRLPESQMLLVAASEGRVEPADIQKLMHKLLRFYKNASICHFGSGGYVARLRQKQAKWTQELLRPEFGLPKALANETSELLRSYVDEHARLFEQRERDGHIREGHGDLRPEHVFLIENAEPEIIDCLEFDADLRRLDSAEELAKSISVWQRCRITCGNIMLRLGQWCARGFQRGECWIQLAAKHGSAGRSIICMTSGTTSPRRMPAVNAPRQSCISRIQSANSPAVPRIVTRPSCSSLSPRFSIATLSDTTISPIPS